MSSNLSPIIRPVEAGLSNHLFWDVNPDSLDMEKNAAFIIKRVMEYGLWNDWKIISNYYGNNRIGSIATTFRELDARALYFIMGLTGLKIEAFRCYTTKKIQAAPLFKGL